jgi:hypothetical protein
MKITAAQEIVEIRAKPAVMKRKKAYRVKGNPPFE